MPASMRTVHANDRKSVDNLEAVTIYAPVNPQGSTPSSATTNYALKEASLHQGFGQNEMDLIQTQARWHLWQADLGTFVPGEQGKIVDSAGDTWFIDAVNYVAVETRYEIDTTLEAGSGLR